MSNSNNFTPLKKNDFEIPLENENVTSYSEMMKYHKYKKIGFLAALVIVSSALTGFSMLTSRSTGYTSRASENFQNNDLSSNYSNNNDIQRGNSLNSYQRRPTIAPNCQAVGPYQCSSTPGCKLCPNGTTCVRADNIASCPLPNPTSEPLLQTPSITPTITITPIPTSGSCGYKIHDEERIRRESGSPFQCIRQITVTCTGSSQYSGSTKGYTVPNSYSGCMKFGSGDKYLDIEIVAKRLCGC